MHLVIYYERQKRFMRNKSIIGQEDLNKISNEVYFHLSMHKHHRDDFLFYEQRIIATLEHLKNFWCIRVGELSLENFIAIYDVYDLLNYDLSSMQSVVELSFSSYVNGEKKINYSLSKWMALHKKFILHNDFFQQIRTYIEPALSISSNYKSVLLQAVAHLHNVIYIKDRHKKMFDLCYPRGHYVKEKIDQYDLSLFDNLINLRIEYLDNTSNWVTHRSIRDCMTIIFRNKFCREIEEEVSTALVQFNQDHENLSQCRDQLSNALWRLNRIVDIRNGHSGWAQETVEAPFYYDEALDYDLSTKEALLALRVHTYVDGKKILNSSVYDLLHQLKAPRIAKSLYNAIYHEIMHEVYRLQELADKDTTEDPLKEEIANYTDHLTRVLNGVFMAVQFNYNSAPITQENKKGYDFSTVESLLRLVIKFPNGDQSSLASCIQSDTYLTPNLQQKLRNISVVEALARSPSGVPVQMEASMFASIVTARKLCALVENGSLAEIERLAPKVDDVNLLIDLPMETVPKEFSSTSLSEFWHHLTFSNIVRDVRVIGANVRHAPILVYLGRYNALILAVCYRRYDVVHYFLNTLYADPEIKGGRKGDYSARDCATLESSVLGIRAPDPRICNLLQHYTQANGRGVIQGTFCSSDADAEYVQIDQYYWGKG